MDSTDLEYTFSRFAQVFAAARIELALLRPQVPFEVDRRAIDGILIDLARCQHECASIALRQSNCTVLEWRRPPTALRIADAAACSESQTSREDRAAPITSPAETVTAAERSRRFLRLADVLGQIKRLLPELRTRLAHACDRRSLDCLPTPLAWANENCSVMAKHQIGLLLDDDMGMNDDGVVR